MTDSRPTPELVPASSFEIEPLAALFGRVYADYFLPLHVDAAAFRSMAAWFDFDLGASRVAVGGDGPEGLVMVAVRGAAAWIGGMGLVPERRRGGTGARLMRSACESARAAGASELWLEVLEQNAPAIALYEHLGFARVRTLEMWSIASPPPASTELRAGALGLAEARAFVREHRNGREPWQRADGTLDRMLEAGPVIDATGVYDGPRLVGAGLHRAGPGRVSLLQYAALAQRQAAVAAALLAALRAGGTPVRCLNLPAVDPAAALARAANATREAGQFEMRLQL